MRTGASEAVSDASNELSQLRSYHPQTDSILDTGEVVDIQWIMTIHLLVRWSTIVLPLQPGVGAHVQRLVSPGSSSAGHCDPGTAVRGQTLLHCTGPGVSVLTQVTVSSSHCSPHNAPSPHLLTTPTAPDQSETSFRTCQPIRTQYLPAACAPAAPASPLTRHWTRRCLTWSGVLVLTTA